MLSQSACLRERLRSSSHRPIRYRVNSVDAMHHHDACCCMQGPAGERQGEHGDRAGGLQQHDGIPLHPHRCVPVLTQNPSRVHLHPTTEKVNESKSS